MKVCGKGIFPLELLSLEGAFPTEDIDAACITASIKAEDSDRGFIINLSKYSPHRSRKGGFDFSLWREKDWEIIPTGTREEEIRVNKKRNKVA